MRGTPARSESARSLALQPGPGARLVRFVRVYFSDVFPLVLPERHIFPAGKYRALRHRVREGLHGRQATFVVGPEATDQDLHSIHEPGYVAAVRNGTLPAAMQTAIGFPWSEAFVKRSLRSCGATLSATRAALQDGTALHLAGGTHHAFAARGEGFCVFNDFAVAARLAQQILRARGGSDRVLILDTDVHQGNGTASIFAADSTVFTASLHGARNFPRVKEASDLDIALPDGTTDEPYLAALNTMLERLDAMFTPDFVFWVSGTDPLVGDRFGRLAVTEVGLAARDRRVLDWVGRKPLVVTMGGGYGRDLARSVAAAAITCELVLRHGKG